MNYFKYERKCKKSNIKIEWSLNNSKNPLTRKDFVTRLIWWSLDLSTFLGIIKYMIIPMLM